MFERYVIFYTFPQGSLENSASSWLGWSSLRSKGKNRIKVPDFDVASITV